MIEIAQVGAPKTATSWWLQKYFGGQATLRDFVKHFCKNYRSRNGSFISRRNTYGRIQKDVQRGVIIRRICKI